MEKVVTQKFINKLILKAGKMAMKSFGHVQNVREKGPRDLVTETDKQVEDFIKSEIMKRFPGHQIVGEESDIVNKDNISHIWYIDPIDGTANFVQGIPIFSICIGYEFKGKLRNGAVYVPPLKELFRAELNKGAYCNKRQIHVSKVTKLIEVTAATGFAYLRDPKSEKNTKFFDKIVPQLRGIRRMGSAAFDLCSVACGRVDAYWEMGLSPWDVMAGKLIVEEAGGKVTDFSGGQAINEKKQVLATNGTSLHEQLLKFFE